MLVDVSASSRTYGPATFAKFVIGFCSFCVQVLHPAFYTDQSYAGELGSLLTLLTFAAPELAFVVVFHEAFLGIVFSDVDWNLTGFHSNSLMMCFRICYIADGFGSLLRSAEGLMS